MEVSREIKERFEWWRMVQKMKTEKLFAGRYRNWEHYCWNHLGLSPSRVDAILKAIQLIDKQTTVTTVSSPSNAPPAENSSQKCSPPNPAAID